MCICTVCDVFVFICVMALCVCVCVYVQMSGCDVYTYVHM